MLEMVEITTPQNTKLQLPLANVSSGIIVKDISGLDPVKSTIVDLEYAKRAGSQFQSSRRESRNIVFKLGLDSRYGGGSVTEIRREINRYLMPDTDVKMTWHMSSGLVVNISGRVEDNINPIFAKDPEANISVLCFDPDFVDPVPVTGGAEAYDTLVEHAIDYQGTVPSGIEVSLDMNGGVTSAGFTVYHRSPANVVKRLVFDYDLVGLDTVRIRTHPGEKSATLFRGSDPAKSILQGITATSEWHMLQQGPNKVGVILKEAQSYYEYTYLNRYGSL